MPLLVDSLQSILDRPEFWDEEPRRPGLPEPSPTPPETGIEPPPQGEGPWLPDLTRPEDLTAPDAVAPPAEPASPSDAYLDLMADLVSRSFAEEAKPVPPMPAREIPPAAIAPPPEAPPAMALRGPAVTPSPTPTPLTLPPQQTKPLVAVTPSGAPLTRAPDVIGQIPTQAEVMRQAPGAAAEAISGQPTPGAEKPITGTLVPQPALQAPPAPPVVVPPAVQPSPPGPAPALPSFTEPPPQPPLGPIPLTTQPSPPIPPHLGEIDTTRLMEGLKVGGAALGQGAKDVMEGLVRLTALVPPPDPAAPEGELYIGQKRRAAVQIMNGLFGVTLAPGMAVGSMASDWLKTLPGEVRDKPFLDSAQSRFIRDAMGGHPPQTAEQDPAAWAEYERPMTYGETLELAVTLGVPAMAHQVGVRIPELPERRVPENAAQQAVAEFRAGAAAPKTEVFLNVEKGAPKATAADFQAAIVDYERQLGDKYGAGVAGKMTEAELQNLRNLYRWRDEQQRAEATGAEERPEEAVGPYRPVPVPAPPSIVPSAVQPTPVTAPSPIMIDLTAPPVTPPLRPGTTPEPGSVAAMGAEARQQAIRLQEAERQGRETADQMIAKAREEAASRTAAATAEIPPVPEQVPTLPERAAPESATPATLPERAAVPRETPGEIPLTPTGETDWQRMLDERAIRVAEEAQRIVESSKRRLPELERQLDEINRLRTRLVPETALGVAPPTRPERAPEAAVRLEAPPRAAVLPEPTGVPEAPPLPAAEGLPSAAWPAVELFEAGRAKAEEAVKRLETKAAEGPTEGVAPPEVPGRERIPPEERGAETPPEELPVEHPPDITLEQRPGEAARAEEAKLPAGQPEPPSVAEPVAPYEPRPEPVPPFYSKAQRVIEARMPERALPQQVRSILDAGGVKAGEITWTGIDEWLARQEGRKVTKAEVLEALRQGEVRVEEVVKGGETQRTFAEIEAEQQRLEREAHQAQQRGDREQAEELFSRAERLTEEAEATELGTGPTKFADRVLPGGEHYRELLLTLPKPEGLTDLGAIARERGLSVRSTPLEDAAKDFLALPLETRQELVQESERRARAMPQFRSPHWDEPNVLAHVRFNERTDAAGKKTLFLEEVQSDWAREIRRKEQNIAGGLVPVETPPQTPAAPFVTSSSWIDLVAKRMLRYAAEHGYDRMAWTTGAQQAERYDLSKQVDAIRLVPGGEESGDFKIYALPLGAQKWERLAEHVPAERLADYIGKDLAAKAVAGQTDFEKPDLRIGGEWATRLYDQMLPQFLNKYAKKWGARVGTVELPGLGEETSIVEYGEWRSTGIGAAKVHAIDITPAMRQSVLTEGQALFAPTARYTGPRGRVPAERVPDRGAKVPAAPGTVSQPPAQGGELRRVGRPDIETLGVGITAPLAREGRLDFRGLQATRPEDIAQLAQVFRDPRYETMFVFYLKGHDIVGHEAISSRQPGMTLPFVKRGPGPFDLARGFAEMRRRMERLNADGYYMGHNHPSGNVHPSKDDRGLSQQFAERVPGFRGHVIIDSGVYTLLSRTEQGNGISFRKNLPLPASAPERGLVPSAPHDVLGAPIMNPGDAARVAKLLQVEPDRVVLLYRDSRGTVRAIQSVSAERFARDKGIAGYIRNQQTAFGAPDTIAYSEKPSDAVKDAASRLGSEGALTDFVEGAGKGAEWAQVPRLSEARIRTYRVSEPTERTYGPDMALQTRGATRLFPQREAEKFAETLRRRGMETEVRQSPRSKSLYQVYGRPKVAAAPGPPTITQGQRQTAAPTITPPAGAPPPAPPPSARRATGATPPTPPRPQPTGDPFADLDAMAREAGVPLRERYRLAKLALLEAKNKFAGAEMLTKALKDAGVSVKPGESPVQVMELARSRASGETMAFAIDLGLIKGEAEKAGVDRWLRHYLDLKQFDKRIRDLSSDPESGVGADGRRADGSLVNPRGFDKARIDASLAQLARKLGPTKMAMVDGLAQRLWALNRQVLTDAKDAGLVSQAGYDVITARGDDYVPVQVLDYVSDVANVLPSGPKAGPGLKYQTYLKTMTGTERDVNPDPFATSLQKAARAYAQINKNRAALTVADLAGALPKLIEKIPGDTFVVPGDRQVISVLRDGARENYAVPPEVARATAFLDAQQMGLLARILRATQTPLKYGATGWNLEFALESNPPRDLWRTLVYSKAGMRGLHPASAVALVNVPFNFLRSLYDVYGKTDLYKRALKSGALFTTIQKNLTPEAFLRTAAGLPGPPSGRKSLLTKLRTEPSALGLKDVLYTPGDVARVIFGKLGEIANLTEEASKLTTFRILERRGLAPREVAYETANYGGSPNFWRNGPAGQEANALFTFFNARWEGTAANVRRIREEPGRVSQNIAIMIALPALMLWANNQRFDNVPESQGGGIKSVPDQDRNKYWIWLRDETYRASDGTMRRKYWKLPKEETAQIVEPVVTAGLDHLKGADPQTASSIVTDALGNLSPLTMNVKGEPTAESVVKAAGSGTLSSANPLVRVPIEIGMNYQSYRQTPLVPRGLAERTLPEEQARATTSPTIMQIAGIFGRFPALAAMGLDVPIKLEHALTSSTGGLGMRTLQAIDTARGKALPETVGEYERTARRPFASRVMGSGGGQQYADLEDRFYTAYDKAVRVMGSLNVAANAQNEARVEQLTGPGPLEAYRESSDALREIADGLAYVRSAQAYVTYHADDLSLKEKQGALADLAETRQGLLDTFREIEQETKGFSEPPGGPASPPVPPKPTPKPAQAPPTEEPLKAEPASATAAGLGAFPRIVARVDEAATRHGIEPKTVDAIKRAIEVNAAKFGVPVPLAAALIEAESTFNPNAKASSSSATGLGQLTKGTARSLGVRNPLDPVENVRGTIEHLGSLMRTYPSVELALAGYHAGETELNAAIRSARLAKRTWAEQLARMQEGRPEDQQTVPHVRRVLSIYETFRKGARP